MILLNILVCSWALKPFKMDLIAEVNINELVELIVPIYDKYLTHYEIQKIVDFYQTPVGQNPLSSI